MRRTWCTTPATTWFCVAAAAWLTIRVVGVVTHGLDWGLPGTGWRTLWQAAMVLVASVGIARPRLAARATAVYAATYAVATFLELLHGADLFGVIPVDMRDRVIHPLVALLALAALAPSITWADRTRQRGA